jgi:hypothetical protein
MAMSGNGAAQHGMLRVMRAGMDHDPRSCGSRKAGDQNETTKQKRKA